MADSAMDTAGAQPELLIRVDDRVIRKSDIDREVQYHSASSLHDAQRRAAQALVVRELLLAEADSQGIREPGKDGIETPDEARIRILIERNVVIPEPLEDDCRRYFDANPGRMRTADRHEVSHILIPAPRDDAEARADARKKAMELTSLLREEPKRFLEIAREHSRCPTHDVGGYLGLIERGQTAPEFEKALSRQPVGTIPEYPVETRYGFHVVLIHARHDGRPLDFESCRDRIADYLREHVRRRAISQYIRMLAADHEIEGFDLDAATSPLVQ